MAHNEPSDINHDANVPTLMSTIKTGMYLCSVYACMNALFKRFTCIRCLAGLFCVDFGLTIYFYIEIFPPKTQSTNTKQITIRFLTSAKSLCVITLNRCFHPENKMPLSILQANYNFRAYKVACMQFTV